MRQDLNLVIPVKGLDTGKSRLSPCLEPRERRELVTWLVRRTITLGHTLAEPSGLFVLTPDPLISTVARASGAFVFQQKGKGLNQAISEITPVLPPRRTIIVPVDLPCLTTKDIILHIRQDGIGLSPDTPGTGTNMLSLPEPDAISCRFGPHSFVAHRQAGIEAGHHVTVIDRPGIRFDLDTPDDLSTWINSPETLFEDSRTPHSLSVDSPDALCSLHREN